MVSERFEIEAPIEIVYSVVRGFADYPKFVPSTRAAVERHANASLLVDFELDLIKTIRYTLKFQEKAPNELTWEMVEGELMKFNRGAWKLKSAGEAKTEAVYEIDVGFGWMVPKSIIDRLTAVSLPETLKAFKNRAEKMHREKKQ